METKEYNFQRKKMNLKINGDLFVLKVPSLSELESHSEVLKAAGDAKAVDIVREWMCSLLINPAQKEKMLKGLKDEFDPESLFEFYHILQGVKKN